MTEPSRRVRPVAGRPAAWIEAGSGPTLVLVHGAGGRADLWQPQLDGLADVARVVALDLPGHGPLRGRGGVSVPAYAEWLAGFLSTLNEGPVVLVGHSMGGAIAQALALTRPDHLAGLILIGTGARLRVLPRIVELLRESSGEGFRLIRDLAFAEGVPLDVVEAVERTFQEGTPLVTLGDYLACDQFDVRDRLAGIQTPALVVAGAEDRLVPLKYGRFLADAIPGARFVEIAGAGHFPHLEQPVEVNAAIREFLVSGARHEGGRDAPGGPVRPRPRPTP